MRLMHIDVIDLKLGLFGTHTVASASVTIGLSPFSLSEVSKG